MRKPPRWRLATQELWEDRRFYVLHPVNAVRTWFWDAYMWSRCLEEHWSGGAFCKKRSGHRGKTHRTGKGVTWTAE